MKENVHNGHRARVRERYLTQSGDGFADHELLELLLFSCIPMRDTNVLAHKLIDEFGSLSLLIESNPLDMVKRCGVNENTAIFISAQNQLLRRYLQSKKEKRRILNSSQAVGEFCLGLLAHLHYERFYMLCLDTAHRLLNTVLLAEGTVREAIVYPRSIVENALRFQSSSVILLHNHPGGSLKPSLSDITLTTNVVKALNLIDIEVADHIIVAENTYFSFAEEGMIINSLASLGEQE